jgi:hypothetical protein
MLDKGQIKDWDGEPEAGGEKPPAKAAGVQDIASAIFAPREALPTGERVTLTPEQVSARKKRGQWIALALFAFVILVFVLTMAKVGGGEGVPQVYHNEGGQ